MQLPFDPASAGSFLYNYQSPLLLFLKKSYNLAKAYRATDPDHCEMQTTGWRYQQAIGPDLQAYRRENPVFFITE
jgi:hypothetical protein